MEYFPFCEGLLMKQIVRAKQKDLLQTKHLFVS